jgi:hypothetical protein
MLFASGGASGDDSAALLALANALVIVGSLSSCKKTVVGTAA